MAHTHHHGATDLDLDIAVDDRVARRMWAAVAECFALAAAALGARSEPVATDPATVTTST